MVNNKNEKKLLRKGKGGVENQGKSKAQREKALTRMGFSISWLKGHLSFPTIYLFIYLFIFLLVKIKYVSLIELFYE